MTLVRSVVLCRLRDMGSEGRHPSEESIMANTRSDGLRTAKIGVEEITQREIPKFVPKAVYYEGNREKKIDAVRAYVVDKR